MDITVTLNRPNTAIPWGFRLSQTASQPEIGRINPHSIASQQLKVGQAILAVEGVQVYGSTNSQILNLMRRCGNSLRLKLRTKETSGIIINEKKPDIYLNSTNNSNSWVEPVSSENFVPISSPRTTADEPQSFIPMPPQFSSEKLSSHTASRVHFHDDYQPSGRQYPVTPLSKSVTQPFPSNITSDESWMPQLSCPLPPTKFMLPPPSASRSTSQPPRFNNPLPTPQVAQQTNQNQAFRPYIQKKPNYSIPNPNQPYNNNPTQHQNIPINNSFNHRPQAPNSFASSHFQVNQPTLNVLSTPPSASYSTLPQRRQSVSGATHVFRPTVITRPNNTPIQFQHNGETNAHHEVSSHKPNSMSKSAYIGSTEMIQETPELEAKDAWGNRRNVKMGSVLGEFESLIKERRVRKKQRRDSSATNRNPSFSQSNLGSSTSTNQPNINHGTHDNQSKVNSSGNSMDQNDDGLLSDYNQSSIRYYGANIPSRSFRALQDLVGTKESSYASDPQDQHRGRDKQTVRSRKGSTNF